MTVAKLSITDLQFNPSDSDQEQAAKLRRLMEEFRRLQQTANALISQTSQVATGTVPTLAPGEWAGRVVPGSPPRFTVYYNDGGTIRTGSLDLS